MVTQRERVHGRGTHDAEGGHGKEGVDEAVRSGVNIRQSADLVKFMEENYSKPVHRGPQNRAKIIKERSVSQTA